MYQWRDRMIRFEISKDYTNNCISITDQKDELKTSFGSDIILSPLEDAETVIQHLNLRECIIKGLCQALRDNGFEDEDIQYIIDSAVEDFDYE